jgi:hypothetical protein
VAQACLKCSSYPYLSFRAEYDLVLERGASTLEVQLVVVRYSSSGLSAQPLDELQIKMPELLLMSVQALKGIKMDARTQTHCCGEQTILSCTLWFSYVRMNARYRKGVESSCLCLRAADLCVYVCVRVCVNVLGYSLQNVPSSLSSVQLGLGPA